MSAVGGMFNIIQAGQLGSLISGMRAKSAPAASDNALTASLNNIGAAKAATANPSKTSSGATDPSNWKLKKGETAIEAFWRLAPDLAKEHAPAIDLMKRLEKMKESGNSDMEMFELKIIPKRLLLTVNVAKNA